MGARPLITSPPVRLRRTPIGPADCLIGGHYTPFVNTFTNLRVISCLVILESLIVSSTMTDMTEQLYPSPCCLLAGNFQKLVELGFPQTRSHHGQGCPLGL